MAYISVVLKNEDIDEARLAESIEAFVERVAQLKKQSASLNAKVIGIKIMVDGVIEFPQQTAALSQSYLSADIDSDGGLTYKETRHDHRGVLELDQQAIDLVVRYASDAGLNVHFHAIGDRAVDSAVTAIERAQAKFASAMPLHTISHLQQVDQDLINRMASAGIAASFTPAWALPWKDYDASVIPYIDKVASVEDVNSLYRQDTRYMSMLYPIRSMLEAGVLVAFGSDAPVDEVTPRPFANMVAATHRSALIDVEGGKRRVVLNRHERVTPAQAFEAFTKSAALTLGEQDLGTLEVGSKADFIVIDRDFPRLQAEAIQTQDDDALGRLCHYSLGGDCDLKVLSTWVAGEPVWQHKATAMIEDDN
jgi:predicted amidohydrolase YtcJ